MADSITTNADLLAAEFFLRSEFDRLNTYDRSQDAWASVHRRAWTEVKKDLKIVRQIDETDLTDSSELEDVTLMKVLEIAYRTSDVDGDSMQAKRWERRYTREFKQLPELTVNDSKQVAVGRVSKVYRG
jgi:hypothetical protein